MSGNCVFASVVLDLLPTYSIFLAIETVDTNKVKPKW